MFSLASVHALQPQATRNEPKYVLTCSRRLTLCVFVRHCGERAWKDLVMDLVLWEVVWGQFIKCGFAQNWVLSRCGVIMWSSILLNLHRWRKSRMNLKLWLVRRKPSLVLARGTFGHFCFWTLLVSLSTFRHDCVGLVFVRILQSHRIALFDVDVLWNCLLSTWKHQDLTIYNSQKSLGKPGNNLNVLQQEKMDIKIK